MTGSSRFAVAIHVLTVLAYASDVPLTSEVIAGSVNTNPVVVRRVLGELRRAGLVASRPGNGGGWRLTCGPDRITLRDVYRAVHREGLFQLAVRRPSQECPVGQHICASLSAFFGEAERAMLDRLAERSISDVLASVGKLPGD